MLRLFKKGHLEFLIVYAVLSCYIRLFANQHFLLEKQGRKSRRESVCFNIEECGKDKKILI